MEHLPATHGYILDDYSALYFHVHVIKICSQKVEFMTVVFSNCQ